MYCSNIYCIIIFLEHTKCTSIIHFSQGENISELQDTIAALAEILDLRCDVKGEMEGRIIESKMDTKIG